MKNIDFAEGKGFRSNALAKRPKGSIGIESHLPGLTDKIKHMLEAK